MWIGSRIRFTVRQPTASPPGYQSPVSGDSAPEPGSPESLDAKACHTSTSQPLANVPRIFSAAVACAQLHQEVSNNHSVSHFETGKECQKLMLDTMSRPISCI